MKDPAFYTVGELQERWKIKTTKAVRLIIRRHDDILQPVIIAAKILVKSENVKKYEASIRKVEATK